MRKLYAKVQTSSCLLKYGFILIKNQFECWIGNSDFVFSLHYAMRTHHRGIYLLAKHDTLTYDEKLQRNNNIYKDKNYVKNLGSSHVNNVNQTKVSKSYRLSVLIVTFSTTFYGSHLTWKCLKFMILFISQCRR